jgi:hypothetical protein
VFIWYNFSGFGILCQEKSGNPAPAAAVPCQLLLGGVGLRREPFLEPDLALTTEQQHELNLKTVQLLDLSAKVPSGALNIGTSLSIHCWIRGVLQ